MTERLDDPARQFADRHVVDVHGTRILYVMATTFEYGPHLAQRIDPLIIGVGPVESAASMGMALARLGDADALPDLIFSLGSAGSRSLDHAGIYQVASVAYRDMDASALGIEKGRTPFLDHPPIIPVKLQIPGLAAASLSTGGAIISGAAYDAIDADMVDMETFAVLRTAARFGVPVIGLRGISDGKSELARLEDWTEYLHIIDEKLGAALDHFEAQLAAGTLDLPTRNKT
ncbi:5'-methylthioadenosine/S-adenosylhomocysteine nucleosidase [Azorhizobium oxalatiphilum]|uniref:5'-methylthioadenosine/S-adenosylhomocysteine nucleosidase n=1 Tax=Azorhizobium oxalatiphilum TaxID=980631 RepID=A0A917CDG0_9HYPH|nr:5'-methylthioadenosine/S-adenosylhomocysteine nucleosidase [Azorhizobium oxalatiphilum]GGF84743.1 5'-methylthioadenosine/S-adenosylhomocysteine nucleosidase [Azorhizobium oxalatiphilum]